MTEPTDLGMLAERPASRFDIESMQAAEMRNVLASMEAMAGAQMRRFDAAGVLVLVFDKTGQALMAFQRPLTGGISDEYARAAMAQLGSGEAQAAPKKRAKHGRR